MMMIMMIMKRKIILTMLMKMVITSQSSLCQHVNMIMMIMRRVLNMMMMKVLMVMNMNCDNDRFCQQVWSVWKGWICLTTKWVRFIQRPSYISGDLLNHHVRHIHHWHTMIMMMIIIITMMSPLSRALMLITWCWSLSDGWCTWTLITITLRWLMYLNLDHDHSQRVDVPELRSLALSGNMIRS